MPTTKVCTEAIPEVAAVPFMVIVEEGLIVVGVMLKLTIPPVPVYVKVPGAKVGDSVPVVVKLARCVSTTANDTVVVAFEPVVL